MLYIRCQTTGRDRQRQTKNGRLLKKGHQKFSALKFGPRKIFFRPSKRGAKSPTMLSPPSTKLVSCLYNVYHQVRHCLTELKFLQGRGSFKVVDNTLAWSDEEPNSIPVTSRRLLHSLGGGVCQNQMQTLIVALHGYCAVKFDPCNSPFMLYL